MIFNPFYWRPPNPSFGTHWPNGCQHTGCTSGTGGTLGQHARSKCDSTLIKAINVFFSDIMYTSSLFWNWHESMLGTTSARLKSCDASADLFKCVNAPSALALSACIYLTCTSHHNEARRHVYSVNDVILLIPSRPCAVYFAFMPQSQITDNNRPAVGVYAFWVRANQIRPRAGKTECQQTHTYNISDDKFFLK